MASDGGLQRAMSETAFSLLSEESRQRMAALIAAKTARPDADPSDQILLAHYLLTGSGEFPTIEEQHRLEVRQMASDLIRPDAEPAPTEGEGWKGRGPA